jgi:hypothetical protein
MKKILVILVLCISLASCINIESEISLNNDGSGIITLMYRISPLVKELGRMGDEVKPCPLPIYKEDFEILLSLYPGLSLKSHSVKEIDGESFVKAVLSFQNVDALTPFGGSGDDSFFFQKSGDFMVFRQDLPFGGEEELDDNTMAMLTEYCSGYYFVYTIHAPGKIVEHTLGEISKNKKDLTYKTGIIEALQSKQRQSIEVKWRL